MAEGNGTPDLQRNWDDHARIDRNIEALRASVVEQKRNVDNLVAAIRDLIDRIPPEKLR